MEGLKRFVSKGALDVADCKTTEYEHAYIMQNSRQSKLFEIMWHVLYTFKTKAFGFLKYILQINYGVFKYVIFTPLKIYLNACVPLHISLNSSNSRKIFFQNVSKTTVFKVLNYHLLQQTSKLYSFDYKITF